MKAFVGIVVLFLVLFLFSGCTQPAQDTTPVITTDNNPIVVPNNDTVPDNTNTNVDTTPAEPQSHLIIIQAYAFNPPSLTIKAGDKVVWQNFDSAQHTVTSDSGNVLNSGLMPKGISFEYTFTVPGTYNYHCEPHPSMKGTIIVE